MSKEAMTLALEALELNNSEWKYLADSGDSGYWKAEDQGHYQLTNEAITALREALTSVPDCASEAKEQSAQPTVQQDIPDLIAGTLGVSRGTAYDLMREALAEQPAQQQEPVISTAHGPWIPSTHPGEEGESYCKRCLLRDKFLGSRQCDPHIVPPEQPAHGCDHCSHAMYAGTKCKHCGRVTEQPTQQQEPVRVPVTDNTYNYAKSLAEAIFKQHFASDEHYSSGRIVWGVNDTVIGILTQIDNMVADMVRKPAQQEPVAYGMWDTMLGKNNRMMMVRLDKGQDGCTVPLQPQRTWVGLTHEEHMEIMTGTMTTSSRMAAVEAKLKEKNT